jgi:predicted CXXCH cytochrome family protein
MKKNACVVLVSGALWLTAVLPALGQSSSISGSRHDLSINGQGPVKAATENQVCVFCHAPHGASPAVPLWNHTLSQSIYTPYNSSTFVQTSPQMVSQRSKLCLSCHDGSIAELGQTVNNGLIATTGPMPSTGLVGKNSSLSSDHPFGFQMPAVDDGEISLSLAAPQPKTNDPAVKLYNNAIECVTCHEPHDPGRDTAFEFMVRSNNNGAICIACHDPSRGILAGWNSGAHAIASNRVSVPSGLPYTDPGMVLTNACSSCHVGHNAPGTGIRLLRGAEDAYSTCANCHGSVANVTPALPDLISDLNKKVYSHPILSSTGLHDPVEALPVTAARHSACQDCHNPHTSQIPQGTPVPPAVGGSQTGTSGIAAADGVTVLKPAANQFEICFKCHGNSNNKPQSAGFALFGPTPYRNSYNVLPDPYNVRLEMQSTATRHNVTQPSRGNVSPSLRPAMLDLNGNATAKLLRGAGLFLYCTDCHNSDSARGMAGLGPNGPHGSNNFHLLERRYSYDTPPAVAGSATSGPAYNSGVTGPYALCDKCHDLDNTLVTQSATQDTVFHQHYLHVSTVGTSCSTCHASHGVQNGTTISNRHLVDFDKTIVGADDKGRLYIDTSAQSCYLTCHGVVHNPKTY